MSDEQKKDPGICERCGKEPATVLVRKVSGAGDQDLHVCKACSEELGAAPTAQGGMLSDPLTILFQSMEETKESAAVCPGCGMGYDRFKETGRLGCARCYDTFQAELGLLLRRIHGATRHAGKVPLREGKEYDQAAVIKRINNEIERAVVSEDYERAAKLRDRLKQMDVAGGARKEPST